MEMKPPNMSAVRRFRAAAIARKGTAGPGKARHARKPDSRPQGRGPARKRRSRARFRDLSAGRSLWALRRGLGGKASRGGAWSYEGGNLQEGRGIGRSLKPSPASLPSGCQRGGRSPGLQACIWLHSFPVPLFDLLLAPGFGPSFFAPTTTSCFTLLLPTTLSHPSPSLM